MGKEILTLEQTAFLKAVAAHPRFRSLFYLTGGTALAVYYLHHRYSDDLDFFSEHEVSPLEITTFVRALRKRLGFGTLEYQKSLNPNILFLSFPGAAILKVEFTYFMGEPLERRKEVNGLQVDSLLDIAVNKAFTIAQNARTRDFIDLYLILKKERWTFKELLTKARLKFDVYIDPLQLGSQLLRVDEPRDYPRMIQKLSDVEWQQFFREEARRLRPQVLGP
jgi:predicted nucleotidyltransferase component of viral defense system